MGKKSAAIYAVGHFLVDFSCSLLMFSRMPELAWFLVYNFCAFALQMPIGFLADRCGRNRQFALLGVLLALCSLFSLPTPVSVVLAGIGNACYHVGGGRDALLSTRKMTALGIFVSPGALGIYLGKVAAGMPAAFLLACVGLIICGAGILLLCDKGPVLRSFQKVNLSSAGIMFAVVILRSLVGLAMEAPWKTGGYILLAALSAVAGKALGGVFGDRFGGRKTGVITLMAAAVLFCIPDWGIAGVMGTILFNMTMPITLRRASDAAPGLEGFAFGLLTLGLFLGYLPVYFGISISPWTGAVLSVLSAGLLMLDKE